MFCPAGDAAFWVNDDDGDIQWYEAYVRWHWDRVPVGDRLHVFATHGVLRQGLEAATNRHNGLICFLGRISLVSL